MKKKDEKLEFR